MGNGHLIQPLYRTTLRVVFKQHGTPPITFCLDVVIRELRHVPLLLTRDTFVYYGLRRLYTLFPAEGDHLLKACNDGIRAKARSSSLPNYSNPPPNPPAIPLPFSLSPLPAPPTTRVRYVGLPY
jgi:hypothetical protein